MNIKAQAAKNLSGLIRKIESYNGTTISQKTVKVNVSNAISQVQTLLNKINALPRNKTVSIKVSQSGSVTPKVTPRSIAQPQMANVEPSNKIGLLSDNTDTSNPVNTRDSVQSRATVSTPIASTGADIRNSMKYSIELLKELENRIDSVSNSLSILDKKAQNATGEEKINYLKQQNTLYLEQLQLQKDLEDKLTRQLNHYKAFLQEKGFTFTSDGNLKNYEEKLILMEKEAERLENVAEAKQKAYSDYKGDNEGTKNSLSSAYDKAKESADKYKNSLSEIKNYLDEYIKVAYTDLPGVKEEFIDINNAIQENIDSINEFNRKIEDLRIDSGYKNHERDIWEVQDKLDKNEIALQIATGQKEIDLIKEKISLQQQLQKEQKDLLDFEKQKRQGLINELSQYGFQIRDDGSIAGYTQKIEQLKKTLSEDEFNLVFEKVEDYLDTTYQKIPELENEWQELNNAIIQQRLELQKLELDLVLDRYLNKLTKIENEYDKISDRLDIIDIKLDNAYGKDKLDLLDEQIKLLEEQMQKQKEMENQYKSMMSIYQNDLAEFGFKFNTDGDILNLDEILNSKQSSVEIEHIKDLVEEYLDIQRDKLPDARKEWEKLNSTIKNSYKEQLNVTKEIEDKILEVYKKQLEERKKLIDEETDHKINSLKKQQDAYNKAREEADYNRQYEDQLATVEELQKKLDIAMKDNSLSGQKKIKDLLEQLKEEQSKLEEMVQDRLDDQINDLFDEEINRVEEDAEKLKESLDETFSEEKLNQMIKDNLLNGTFTDLDGNIRNLQEVLIEFEDKFGDGMSAIGSLIKSELITNLEIAKDTMKDLSNILTELDLNKFSGQAYSVVYDTSDLTRGISQVSKNQSQTIEFNSPLINIEGNVDSNVMDELKALSKEIENTITRNIVQAIR